MNIAELLGISELSTFNIIAGLASILGFLAVVISYALKKLGKFKGKMQEAVNEFEDNVAAMESTGGTISGRTDLGFLVLIELGIFRDQIQTRRNRSLLLAIFSTMFFIFVSIDLTFVSIRPQLLGGMSLRILMFIGMMLYVESILYYVIAGSMQKGLTEFEFRIKKVWGEAVGKRISSNSSNDRPTRADD